MNKILLFPSIVFLTSCGHSEFRSNLVDSLKKENAALKNQLISLGQTPTDSNIPEAKQSYYGLSDFIDNTINYKGNQILLVAHFDDNLQNYSLRDRVGSAANFFIIGDGAKSNLSIYIPKGLNVPQANGMDPIEIIFKCNQGKLVTGNIALSVKRHDSNLDQGLVYVIK